MGAVEEARTVVLPGIPGTDRSERLTLHTTVTVTYPPAKEMTHIGMTWGTDRMVPIEISLSTRPGRRPTRRLGRVREHSGDLRGRP